MPPEPPPEWRIDTLETELDNAQSDLETLTALLVGLIRHIARSDPQAPFAMASLLHQIARQDEATAQAIADKAPDAPARAAISSAHMRALAAQILAPASDHTNPDQ